MKYSQLHTPKHLAINLGFTYESGLPQRFAAIWQSLWLTSDDPQSEHLRALTQAVITDQFPATMTDVERSAMAIAIGAYWHQDLLEVRSRIFQLQDMGEADIDELVLAYAIAYACRGKLQPPFFIQQICQDFSNRRSLSASPIQQTHLIQELHTVQTLVNQGASATIAHTPHQKTHLSIPIASSLYYFLSTPHHWQLINTRARKHSPLVALQSSAIAAAYLGYCDPPINQILPNTTQQLSMTLWQEWVGIHSHIPVTFC
ncbi:MAG: hypothetical protein NW214_14390 [Pseudanabaenaceae cyanobacterium bins.39]|nr:hypothetical protein [Pseudanabaenaceae cyanobacterium bins.39]